MAKRMESSRRSKHVDIRYHYVREKVMDGTVKLVYCSSENMLADMFTKPIARDLFELHRGLLGIESPSGSVDVGTLECSRHLAGSAQ